MSLRSREHHAFGAPDWSQRQQRFQPLTSIDRTPVEIAFVAPCSGSERGSAGQCRGLLIPENPGSAGVGPPASHRPLLPA